MQLLSDQSQHRWCNSYQIKTIAEVQFFQIKTNTDDPTSFQLKTMTDDATLIRSKPTQMMQLLSN